jgi:PhnB protein
MTNKVKAIPDGYHSITPYLFIKGAGRAIEFYKNVFGAKERLRLEMPGGGVAHAELEIGNSVVMMGDECPAMEAKSPQTIGGSPVMVYLYVEDVDAVFKRAVAEGAKVLQPVEDKFYGDRSGSITDPFGHLWGLATHKEDVPPDEINRRAAAMFQQKKG